MFELVPVKYVWPCCIDSITILSRSCLVGRDELNEFDVLRLLVHDTVSYSQLFSSVFS